MITISDLTPEQRARYTNGCGPGCWKRGSWWRRLLLALLIRATRNLDAICRQHDVDYLEGGTEKDRQDANERGRQAIFKLGAGHGLVVRWLCNAEGEAFYFATDRDGKKYFNYGTPRTLADLKP